MFCEANCIIYVLILRLKLTMSVFVIMQIIAAGRFVQKPVFKFGS